MHAGNSRQVIDNRVQVRLHEICQAQPSWGFASLRESGEGGGRGTATIHFDRECRRLVMGRGWGSLFMESDCRGTKVGHHVREVRGHLPYNNSLPEKTGLEGLHTPLQEERVGTLRSRWLKERKVTLRMSTSHVRQNEQTRHEEKQ